MALTAFCVAVAGTTMRGTVASLIVTTTVRLVCSPELRLCMMDFFKSNRLSSRYNIVYTKNVRLNIVLSADFSRVYTLNKSAFLLLYYCPFLIF